MGMLGEIKATVAATKQAVDDLAGPQGRVTKIEAQQVREGWKDWVHTAIVIPLSAGLSVVIHKVLR